VCTLDYRLGGNFYDKLTQKKDSLIQQFLKGDLTKREFLIANFEFIQGMEKEPFSVVDSFEKGFFNYQYYNTLAKYYRMEAGKLKSNPKYARIFNEYVEKSNFYYSRKDKTVLKVLEVVEYKNIDAYYIKVKSEYLKNRLIEIVFKDYDHVIFHTRSLYLIQKLIDEDILSAVIKKSLIDLYINQKY